MYRINEKQIILAVFERKPELFNEKEKRFLSMVFGINGEREHTSRELSKALDIPVPRIVKTYKEILEKAKADIVRLKDDPRKSFLESLDLSTRAVKVLHRNNVYDLNDLAGLSKTDLVRMRNIGRKTAAEIEEKAAEFGIILKNT